MDISKLNCMLSWAIVPLTSGRITLLYSSAICTHTTGGDYDDEEEEFVRDHLSDYQVVTKLGDSADPKVPVVCVQIAELSPNLVTT